MSCSGDAAAGGRVWSTTASYPHKVEYATAEAAAAAEVCGYRFPWVRTSRDVYFDSYVVELGKLVLDKLAARDHLCSYASGLLSALRLIGAGGSGAGTAAAAAIVKDAVRTLETLDRVVQLTEHLLAVHEVVSRPTEVGTFCVCPPETRLTVLRERVLAGENSMHMPVWTVYRLARETLPAWGV